MKKSIKLVLAMVAFMTFSQASFAQLEKGHWLVGASSNLGFSSGKEDKDQDDATSRFNITPQVGYFVIDNLAVGLSLDVESEKTGDEKVSFFGVGPMVRYYLPMKIFGQLSYTFGSTKFDDGTDDVTFKTSALGIAAGYAIFLNDNIAIEPSLYYNMTSSKLDVSGAETANGSTFGVNVGFSLYLGDGK